MILVVPPKNLRVVEAYLKRRREKFFAIGRIEPGKPCVVYSGQLPL